jgi:predicted transcriptional regulator
MTKDVLLSVRVSSRLNSKLEKWAKLTARTKSWLVDSLLNEHVDREIAYAESIREAQRSVAQDGGIPHAQVVRELRARGTACRTKARRQAAE